MVLPDNIIRPLQFRYVQFVPLQYRYDMHKKGQHRKFNVFDDIFARITITQALSHGNEKQLYIELVVE